MALQEEMVKQGNWLFRWRSYIPGILILFSAIYFPEYKYLSGSYETNLYWLLGCFAVSCFGQWIRFMVVGYTPARTSGRNTKEQIADVVNQTGIYSLVRHPLYIGNFFMFLGLILYLRSPSLLAVFFLFYWFYYERIILAEEDFLRGKFGKEYLDWTVGTPALIPNFKKYVPAKLGFSFRNILKREYAGMFGILFFFLLFDAVAVFINEPQRFHFDWTAGFYPVQIYAFLVGTGGYIILRVLAKYTNVLKVEGR